MFRMDVLGSTYGWDFFNSPLLSTMNMAYPQGGLGSKDMQTTEDSPYVLTYSILIFNDTSKDIWQYEKFSLFN